MSGHSKWANIKRKKGAEDARRGKIFTRLARDITMAAREGNSGDPAANPRLKIAIEKAKAENMPKDNIERAIARGLGKLDDGEEMIEAIYEGYGPDGVAYLVETLSDNKNRTLSELKRVFNKAGGSLASAGSVLWQFDQKGVIVLGDGAHDFDTVFMVAAEAGADDVVDEGGAITVYTPREALNAVEEALRAQGYPIQEAALKWEAKNETTLPVDRALVNMKLMSDLEELDDVQSVASTLMISDEIIAAFETA
ncbi:MAG: YebC/PmpR family DNA-binding transcriptional regulator [Candidatus Flexifilum sp.]|jgi:YebC/PmpR family DNA-binding regulatory protein